MFFNYVDIQGLNTPDVNSQILYGCIDCLLKIDKCTGVSIEKFVYLYQNEKNCFFIFKENKIQNYHSMHKTIFVLLYEKNCINRSQSLLENIQNIK